MHFFLFFRKNSLGDVKSYLIRIIIIVIINALIIMIIIINVIMVSIMIIK